MQNCLNKDRLEKKKKGQYLHINVWSFNPHHNRTLQTDVIITIPAVLPSLPNRADAFKRSPQLHPGGNERFKKKKHAKESVQVSGEPADSRHLNSPARLRPPSFWVPTPAGISTLMPLLFSPSLILPVLSHLIWFFPTYCRIHLVSFASPKAPLRPRKRQHRR